MSTLLVEVCEVAAVEKHPHADRLGIATVKGWKTAVGFDPATGRYEFAPGERCIYFPPDSVLPPALANSPYKVCKNKSCKGYNKTPSQLPPAQQAKDDRCGLCGTEVQWRDGTPGRTGAMAFCAELPRDLRGVRPAGGRVRAARIRGLQSFGFIMKIDPTLGDDPSWPVGTDLREHFGVTKWEPPAESADGEVEPAHPAFHAYTDIEHLANFPGVLADGEEVILTEKLHGKNCRLGLVLAKDESGTPQWTWMAGSHGQRRKETFATVRRFDANELVEQFILQSPEVPVGQVFAYDGGKFWRIVEVKRGEAGIHLHAEEVYKTAVGAASRAALNAEQESPARLAGPPVESVGAASRAALNAEQESPARLAGPTVEAVGAASRAALNAEQESPARLAGPTVEAVGAASRAAPDTPPAQAPLGSRGLLSPSGYEVRSRRSEFWEPMTDNVRALLTHVRDEHPWPEPKQGIVLFGELYGTQDMKYGLKSERGFRAFDLAINGRYLDFDVKQSLCERFGVGVVPILYRGPFSTAMVEKHTDGPTVMCKPEEAGAFGGREGVVVTPAVERIADVMMPTSTNGRVIFKSVSADYLARRGGTDAH